MTRDWMCWVVVGCLGFWLIALQIQVCNAVKDYGQATQEIHQAQADMTAAMMKILVAYEADANHQVERMEYRLAAFVQMASSPVGEIVQWLIDEGRIESPAAIVRYEFSEGYPSDMTVAW